MSSQSDVLKSMKEMESQFSHAGLKLQMPPHSNKTLGTEYIDMDFGKSLTAKIPFQEKFTNPMHMYQGGFLCAAFDDAYGPLTYMAAGQPVVTIEMSTSFIRPFTVKDEFIVIKAEVVSKTKTLIVLKAEAHSKAGKLIASSTNHSFVVSEQQMKPRGP